MHSEPRTITLISFLDHILILKVIQFQKHICFGVIAA